MLQRHSSRWNRLDQAVLNQRLEGAASYDRIAGYFRSSLFEVAGEALAKVTGPVVAESSAYWQALVPIRPMVPAEVEDGELSKLISVREPLPQCERSSAKRAFRTNPYQ